MNNDVNDLKSKKAEIINEWLEFLDTNSEEWLWSQKNKVFATNLHSILYKLLKDDNDEYISKQYELLNQTIPYINKNDKIQVKEDVKGLKKLEEWINIENGWEELGLKDKLKEKEAEHIEQANRFKQALSDAIDPVINKIKLEEELKTETNDVNKNITLTKGEYETLKRYEDESITMQRYDFVLIINSGAILPVSHPNYYEDRVKIELYDLNKQNIVIDGNKYTIKTQEQFNSIKAFVSENLNALIEWSKRETNSYLDNNAYDGGVSRKIKVKCGQLLINVDGQVTGDIGRNADDFINYLKELIISEKIINISTKNDDNQIQNEEYEWHEILENNDFVVKISDGGVMPINHSNYDKNRTEIEIISEDYINITKCNIKIDGNEYNIESEELFNKIKDILNKNINSLISFSRTQTKNYFAQQDILLGCDRNIVIKSGNLIININGAIKGECGEFCKKIINEIRELIINESNIK